ncbi:MAG: DUF1186 domain-containing protein [Phycisphaerales bacterium]|nr:DUF1186 domain-containing protein [Phycisphaerales bacterium]
MSQEQDQDMDETRTDVPADPEDSGICDLDAAIAELDAASGKLPKAGIKWIREHRDEAVPRLIEIIRTATASAIKGECPEGEAHFFALFLLAEFRAKEALPTILEAISLPDELPFDLFGDAISSVMGRMLLVLADEPTDVIDALIANEDINEYVRWEAAQSYLLLVRDGRISREEAVGRLADHLRVSIDRADKPAVGYLVSVLVSLAPREALELIDEAYDSDMVDLWIVRPEEVKQSISEGESWIRKELDRFRPSGIEDTITELETWASFSEQPPPQEYIEPPKPSLPPSPPIGARPAPSPILPQRKTGRNEPCLCGSGKKYKKCCALKSG